MSTEPPFEPKSVTIEDLPAALAGIDDEDVVHALQQADRRKGAAAVYERRVDAIRGSRPDLTDEDRDRGYSEGRWSGLPNFECLRCPYANLDEGQTQRHVAANH